MTFPKNILCFVIIAILTCPIEVFSDSGSDGVGSQKTSIYASGQPTIIVNIHHAPDYAATSIEDAYQRELISHASSENPCDQVSLIRYCKSCVAKCQSCPNFFASARSYYVPSSQTNMESSQLITSITEEKIQELISNAVELANQQSVSFKIWKFLTGTWDYLTDLRSMGNLGICVLCGGAFILSIHKMITLANRFEHYALGIIICLVSMGWPYIHRAQQKPGDVDWDTCPLVTFFLTFWKTILIPTMWMHPALYFGIVGIILVNVYTDQITDFYNHFFT